MPVTMRARIHCTRPIRNVRSTPRVGIQLHDSDTISPEVIAGPCSANQTKAPAGTSAVTRKERVPNSFINPTASEAIAKCATTNATSTGRFPLGGVEGLGAGSWSV